MDTITLCKVCDDASDISYFVDCLRSSSAPDGCKIWITKIPHTSKPCLWIKVNCHTLLHVLNTESEDIQVLTNIVADWLLGADLSLAEMNISRVDYDRNFCLPQIIRNALIDTLQQLRVNMHHMARRPYNNSIYYMSKSRHVQAYDKPLERNAKNCGIKSWEMDVLRIEMQCCARHIDYMRRYHGVPRTWDTWITMDMQQRYYDQAVAMIPPGDFYSLAKAMEIVEQSNLSRCKRRKLTQDLQLVSTAGMDAMKERYKSVNTYKDHLADFAKLSVNPLTIPAQHGIEHIANPFV